MGDSNLFGVCMISVRCDGIILVSGFGPIFLLLAKKYLWFMTARRLTNFNGNGVNPIKELRLSVCFFLPVA